MTRSDLAELLGPLTRLAEEAGRAVEAIYQRGDVEVSAKADASPLTAADLASQEVLLAGSTRLAPEIPHLSEETAAAAYAERRGWRRFWSIDPLDGTKEFLKRNGEFTINVALIEDGVPVLGVVHAPILRRSYIGALGHGAFRLDADGEPRPIRAAGTGSETLAIVASRSHAGPHLEAFLAALPEHRLVSMGSSLKLCLVAEGAADLYPRLGPTMEWDTAAAHAVVLAAGGQVVDTAGEPLAYNKEDLHNPYFIVLGERAVPWREAWAAVGAATSPALADPILERLVCPACRGRLEPAAEALACPACRERYPRSAAGGFDLRPRRYPPIALEVDLSRPLPGEAEYDSGPLPLAPRAEVDFTGVAVPHHLTPELLSHFPHAKAAGSAMLDLGCGTAIHRGVCERAGFLYAGLDWDNPRAPFLGDAHALPFCDDAFDFVLSIAVLEHIRNPFVMMREVARVLAPGGRLVGTVAFLEPFHGDSFYHHTHLGVLNTLDQAGLRAEHVAPMVRWNVVVAQAQNGLFPKLPKRLARALGWPLDALHRAWWRLAVLSGRASEGLRLRSLKRTTGGFSFIAHRPHPALHAHADTR